MNWGLNYYCIDGTQLNTEMNIVMIAEIIGIILAILIGVFTDYKSISIVMLIISVIGSIFIICILDGVNHTYKIESDKKIEVDIKNYFSENVDIIYDKNSQSSVQKNGIILSSDCTYEFIVDYDEDKITIYPISENNNKKSIIIYGNK